MKRWAAILFLGFFLLSCVSEKKEKGAGSEDTVFHKISAKPVPVTSYVVGVREVPLVINAEGKTEPTDRYEAKAPTAVKVLKVFVEEGAKVQPGDPLVKFDDELAKLRLNVARSEIREADAGISEVNYLEKNRDQLVQDGKMSDIEAEGLDERNNLYQAQLDRAKAQVELLERLADLEQLNSPIAGFVTKRGATEGSDVAEDQLLIEVVRLDPLYFTFKVPVDEVTALDKGAEVSISLAGLPGQELTGEIAAVGAESEPQSGGVDVKVKIPNPDVTLKADMRGTVRVRTQAKKKILPIPDTALVKTDHSNYVYKIDGGKVRKTAVDLGDPANGQPTVEKGLAEGDTIVSSSEEDLRDGAAVEIQATKSALQ